MKVRHPYLKHNIWCYTRTLNTEPQTPTFYTLIDNRQTLGTRKFSPTSSCNLSLSMNSYKSTTQQRSRRIYFKAPISEWVIFIYRRWQSLRTPKTNNNCIDSLWEKSVDDCITCLQRCSPRDNGVIIFAASIYIMYNIHLSGFMCEVF